MNQTKCRGNASYIFHNKEDLWSWDCCKLSLLDKNVFYRDIHRYQYIQNLQVFHRLALVIIINRKNMASTCKVHGPLKQRPWIKCCDFEIKHLSMCYFNHHLDMHNLHHQCIAVFRYIHKNVQIHHFLHHWPFCLVHPLECSHIPHRDFHTWLYLAW